jgi:hypothetical protein
VRDAVVQVAAYGLDRVQQVAAIRGELAVANALDPVVVIGFDHSGLLRAGWRCRERQCCGACQEQLVHQDLLRGNTVRIALEIAYVQRAHSSKHERH